MKTNSSTTGNSPNAFVAQQQADVIGELHGFDRVRLQGTLPPLYGPEIMHSYLWKEQVLYKDFAAYPKDLTQHMRTEIEGAALQRQRPVLYLRSAHESKEEKARAIAEAEQIDSGVILRLQRAGDRPPFIGRTGAKLGDRYLYISKLEQILRERIEAGGQEFYDFSDFATLHAPDSEAIDGYHGSERTYLRLFIAMLEKGSRLNGLADLPALETVLAKSTAIESLDYRPVSLPR